MFQVVTFANDVCEGDDDDRNGTCYTSGECENRGEQQELRKEGKMLEPTCVTSTYYTGGKEIGSCADGFGVCCACERERERHTHTLKIQFLPVEPDFSSPLVKKNNHFLSLCLLLFPVSPHAVTLECGDTSSQNLTYLVEDDFTHAEVGPSCVYSICRSDEDVCRIRLDFVVRCTIVMYMYQYSTVEPS